MSKIDIHNYEAFYLDYLEGNLDKEDTAQLKLFLDNNPDIKEELDEFEWVQLDAPKIEIDKSNLHQNINKDNVEDYIFASVEKVIDTDDEIELNEYLNHSAEAMAMAKRYRHTILPQKVIHYPEKNKLKKRGTAIYYLTPLVGAAAAVFLFFIINPKLSEKQELQQQTQFTENIEIFEYKIDSALTENTLATKNKSITNKNIAPEKSTDIPVLIATTESKPTNKLKPETNESGERNNEKKVPEFAKIESLKQLVPIAVNHLENNWQNNSTALAEMKFKEPEEFLVAELVSKQQAKVPIKRGINLFKILEFGVKSFNKLNERNYAVVPNYDISGQLKTVSLITDERTFTTPAI